MESQAAVFFLLIAGLIAAFWAFKYNPKDSEPKGTTPKKSQRQRKRKQRDDYVCDVYINRRFGKRK